MVAGNLIGTTSAGTQPLSNLDLGVFIDNSPGNVVGPGNVLSANGLAGVEIVAAGSQQNLVAHNNVGEGIGGKIFSSAGQEVLSSNGSEPGIPIYANAQLYGVVVWAPRRTRSVWTRRYPAAQAIRSAATSRWVHISPAAISTVRST